MAKKEKTNDAKELADEIRLAFSSESIPDKYARVIEEIATDAKTQNTNEFFLNKYGINLALAKVAQTTYNRFSKALALASDKIELEQTDRVLALAVQGLTPLQISQKTGLTPQAVDRHINKAGLDLHPRDPMAIRRTINLEILRLDGLFQQYYISAQSGDVQAAKLCLQISERRSKLLGLDSPSVHAILTTKISTPGNVDLSKLTDEELNTLVRLQEKAETSTEIVLEENEDGTFGRD